MEVIRALQQFASPSLDQLMLLITNLGTEMVYTLLLIVTYLGIDAKAGRRIGIYFLAGFYLNEVLKGLFDTQRPFESDPSIVRSPAAQETALGPGFPSGHAQASTTFWGLAAMYVRRWWFLALAALIVLLVSVSRLYLGLHLPVDVIGGILIGLALISLAAAIDRLALGVPPWLTVLLGLSIPLAIHLLWPTADSNIILGSIAAFIAGPALVGHNTGGPVLGRAVVTLVGVVLAFGYLFGSSAILSDAIKDHALWGFVRYLLLGAIATILVPWIGRAVGLTPERKRA